MRFLYTAVAALCAAVVVAQQNNAISIPAGASTLDVTAGQPLTIQWTNPSSGTVTIKLQQSPVTPSGGVVLASGIPASAETATLQIPAAADVNNFQYTIEIIDDTNTSNINFSPNFGIKGATGTATGTASSASATSTGSITGSTTGSTTATGSTTGSTESSTSSTSPTTTNSSSSTTESSSAATTSSGSSSPTQSSASPSSTTSAPNSNTNGASGLKVQGGLLAMAVGLVAVM